MDVAWAWFVHRQDARLYEETMDHARITAAAHPLMTQASSSPWEGRDGNDSTRSAAAGLPPALHTAFAFGPTRPEDRTAWAAAAGDADTPVWPPPPPGSPHDPTIALSASHQHPHLPAGTHPRSHSRAHMFAVQLAALLPRLSWQLRSWLRPAYLDTAFLARAGHRYARFLALHAAHPQQLLVPAADIALLWHTHLGLSGQYAAACRQLFGPSVSSYGMEPVWRPDYLDLTVEQLEAAYGQTAALFEAMYGEPYDDPDTAWLPLNSLHPFADPTTSPLAFGLRALDRLPSPTPGSADAAAQRAAMAAARRAAADVCPAAARVIFPPGSIDIPGLDDDVVAAEAAQLQRSSGLLAGASAGIGAVGGAGGVPVNRTLLPCGAVNFDMLGMSGVGPACGGGAAGGGGGGGGCPRAGAHGLFVVWLGSSRAEEFFSRETCKGMCLVGSWSIRVSTIERMTRALAGQMYFRETPAYHTHPFLLGFTPRPGLWLPRRVSAAGVTQSQELRAQVQAATMAAVAAPTAAEPNASSASAISVTSDASDASDASDQHQHQHQPPPCTMFLGQPPSLAEAEAYLCDPRGVMAGITAVVQLTTPQRSQPPQAPPPTTTSAAADARGGSSAAGADGGGAWRKLVQGLLRRASGGSGGRRSRRAAPLPSGGTGAVVNAEEWGPNTIGGGPAAVGAGPVAEGVRAAAAAARIEPAPLWAIMRRPMYANRAATFFDYLRRRAAAHAGAGGGGGASGGDDDAGSDLAAAQRRLAAQKSTGVTDGRARGRGGGGHGGGGGGGGVVAPADAYIREVMKCAGGVKEADRALAALRRDFALYGPGA
ncbi:hypothetical protein HYH02_008895 [Chlamydomonas schloesseri]|uniref:Uncharacterized protein n=1 Tax=Chlamydomonas schloesseri TaxID=2026947 RepID=A0A836B1U8_9CHLO|nr:hypothetical protein HYH02_008895 [Chlamydomonas schloesseri]|eukprot:KAG2445027.1 hypothetical protein HYH02_008895 [Chlamydomonas schloesseri]